jgi:hypothetical protein
MSSSIQGASHNFNPSYSNGTGHSPAKLDGPPPDEFMDWVDKSDVKLPQAEPVVSTSTVDYMDGVDEATVLAAREAAAMPPLPEAARIDPSVAEGASPWLDEYIEFSRLWSPRSYPAFHEAIGLWVLSTVAARRVCADFGGKKFTNLSIALATPTSTSAKTTGTKIGMGTLKEAGLAFMLAPDDATPQAFVRGMAGHVPSGWSGMSREKQLAIQERLAFAGQRGWFYDEFGQKVSAMMKDGGHMADFRSLLRRLDDAPDSYEYESIGRGSDYIVNPYLALLANLTPADLKPFAKKGAALWGDGFWARFAFVAAPPYTKGLRGRFPKGERVTPPKLVNKLKAWHKRLGIPKAKITERMDADGKGKGKGKVVPDLTIDRPEPRRCVLGEGVEDAFYRYHDSLLDLTEQSPNHDLAGNYTRLAEKALRVAMSLGSLENDDRIEMRHWARAQQIAESWRQSLHYIYAEVTGSEQSVVESFEDKIIKLIEEKGPMTKREIYQFIRGLDSGSAATVLQNMVNADLLEEDKTGKTTRYRLVG